MKRGSSPSPFENEFYHFGNDNKLRIFPPNTFNFKPKNPVILDNVQDCILDNFWYQYNNRREDKGYMLAILNSLAEYFHMMNGKMQSKISSENNEEIPLYVIYEGARKGIYTKYEEVIAQKLERKNKGGIQWRKYSEVDEALSWARRLIGINYYIEPEAKDYIQKQKKIINENKINMNISEAGSSRIPSYKDIAKKDILNEDIIERKIKERLEAIIPQLKKNLKEEVLQEARQDINEKFQSVYQEYEENIKKDYEDYIKKDYDSKMNINISDYENNEEENNEMIDENMLDIRGHGQPPEY